MKLSESLRRGIMESFAGGIINKFKIKRRRITLFFEDILAEYVKECEKSGYGKEMEDIGELWGLLGTKTLTPPLIRKLSTPLVSAVAKMVWTSLGILEDVDIKRTNDTVLLTTKKEAITKIIGKNHFVLGAFKGVLEVYFNSDLIPVEVSQNKESCKYLFKIAGRLKHVEDKDKDAHNRFGALPNIKGYTLKDIIARNIFQIKGNQIYFRGKHIFNSENTLFHILGNRNILLERVPEISYKYFAEVIDINASKERKLKLLKTLLQVMGWGVVKITIVNGRKIGVELSYLPRGLQSENDNWNFLIKTILGYLWIIDKRLIIQDIETKQGSVNVVYRSNCRSCVPKLYGGQPQHQEKNRNLSAGMGKMRLIF